MAGKATAAEVVATKWGCTKAEAGRMIDTVMETIIELTVQDGECSLAPHKLYVKHRDARKGRNPRTGEELLIPAKDEIRYKTIKARAGGQG
jgi:DNA-binding protein HU-beta